MMVIHAELTGAHGGQDDTRQDKLSKSYRGNIFCCEAASDWSSAFTRLIIISLCIQLRFTVANAQNSYAFYAAGIVVIWGYLH